LEEIGPEGSLREVSVATGEKERVLSASSKENRTWKIDRGEAW